MQVNAQLQHSMSCPAATKEVWKRPHLQCPRGQPESFVGTRFSRQQPVRSRAVRHQRQTDSLAVVQSENHELREQRD